jgi:hypothetical protein
MAFLAEVYAQQQQQQQSSGGDVQMMPHHELSCFAQQTARYILGDRLRLSPLTGISQRSFSQVCTALVGGMSNTCHESGLSSKCGTQ